MQSFDRPVLVYSFRCFAINAGAVIVPPFEATEQAIKHRFRGEALPHTGEAVDVRELDSEGR